MNISDIARQNLSEVSESLLLPLYIRALETKRPNAILKDQKALELVQKLKLDASQFNLARVGEEVQVAILLRNQQFDCITHEYLNCHPNPIVVYLGCGLDTRFERLDNGQVEWFDLDLSEVIDLRRQLIGDETDRYHLLPASALDRAWMDAANVHPPRSFLFIAEGLFMFFEPEQVKQLVLDLKNRFSKSELVFDAFSPFYVWGNNRRVARTKIGVKANWALKSSKELESWSEGIHLLDEWYPFLCPEPRLAHIQWVRFIPLLSKTTGIFSYQLGS